jgi:hypothetical protein
MQTFLPFSDFEKSARCLDNKRLGKQRVEGFQILKSLSFGPYQRLEEDKWVRCSETEFVFCKNTKSLKNTVRKTPWYNHPATKMWKGHESCLRKYIQTVCKVWVMRGYEDTILTKLGTLEFGSDTVPDWVGNESFHSSHRSNLLRKDKEWYGKFGWKEKNNLPYIWPK